MTITGPDAQIVDDTEVVVLHSIDDAVERLDDPPAMPTRWVAVGRWGGVHAAADTMQELVSELGPHAAVDDAEVYLCPCAGDHSPGCDGSTHPDGACDDYCEQPCGCERGCRGECWDGREAPDGCWQRIVALHDVVVPVVRHGTVGWSSAMWHDHDPGPGGMLVVPRVHTDEFGCRSCGGWNCAGVIVHGDLDVACEWGDGLDDDARDEIVSLWTDSSDDAIRRAELRIAGIA